MKFSLLSDSYVGQGMFQIMNKARALEREGKELIHFELGDPDFNTPLNIKEKAIKAINYNYTHYTESGGMYALREAACNVTFRSRKFKPEIEQTLVTCGANMQIYLALAVTCNPGDKVLLPKPYFPTYLACVRALGLTPAFYDLHRHNEFKINPYSVDVALRNNPETKVIIINSPSNPTGAVSSESNIQEVFRLARQHDIWVISDEVYARQIWEGEFFSPSMIDKCQERTVVVNGFSKSFAMTGWRLGVVTAPKELISRMQLLLETIISCVPPFIQLAGIEALTGEQDEVFNMVNQYRCRSKLMTEELNQIKGLHCLQPKGALYCWASTYGTEMTSAQFAALLLSKGVVVCPGEIFGKEGYIRLCYCTSEENIITGLERMREWDK